MRLDDLLQVLREEFAQAADQIDARLADWLGGGAAAAEAAAGAIGPELERLAATARVLALEGLARVVERQRDITFASAFADEETMALSLGWLAAWRGPLEAAFAAPGSADAAEALLAWLAEAPMPIDADDAAALRAELVRAAALPEDDTAEPLPDATPGDVSLELPDDIDRGLFETFVAEAPAQLARLADLVRELVQDRIDPAALTEAQRVAHTFKGSGNIIGIRGVGRLAHRIEDLLDFAAQHGARLPAAMAHDLELATAALDQMVYALRGEEEAPADAQARLQALIEWQRAIVDGCWAERAQQQATRATPAATPAASAPAAAAVAEAAPQLRVDVARLDRLLRRAGQGLVHSGRLGEQLRTADERLRALAERQRALGQRVAELHLALERQGVTLHERSRTEGEGFDPLELDRYDQLQTLVRFVAELADDGREIAQALQAGTGDAQGTLREHQEALAEQHRELLGARLVPFRQIVSRLKRTVAQTAAALGREVRLDVMGDAVPLDSDVLDRLTEPLLHLLRNAVDHGIEAPDDRVLLGKPAAGTITLTVRRDGHQVWVQCRDDGRGIDLAAVHARALAVGLLSEHDDPDTETLARTILLPGFSTRDEVTEISGRGVGLDVVAERVRALKGQLDISTEPLAGTTFTLRLPASGGVMHALLVEVAGQTLALPTEAVRRAVAPGVGQIDNGLWRPDDGEALPWRRLAGALGLADSDKPDVQCAAVIVRGARGDQVLAVDRVVDARELILQDLSLLLRCARGVVAAALRPDGRTLFVIDPLRLDEAALPGREGAARALRDRARLERRRILVVDDSISVRKALVQLLADAGWEPVAARDGFDALQRLQEAAVELVLTDLEMPQMSGLDLTRHLRQQDTTRALPVVMITSRGTEKHRAAALAAGVDRYLTKPYTDQQLIALVRELLAAPSSV